MSDIEAVTPRAEKDEECELEEPEWTRDDENRHAELMAMDHEELSIAERDELERLKQREEAFLEAGLEALRNGKIEDEELQDAPRIKTEKSNKCVWRVVFGLGIVFVAIIVTALVLASGGSSDDESSNGEELEHETVTTMFGTVRGVLSNGVATYMGIPYARPPVGEYRWQPPHYPSRWEGVLNATSFKPQCMNADGKGTEDCLYLNVYVPKMEQTADSSPLPVMYFIHGGCYTWGSDGPTTEYLNGENLVKGSNEKVILVTAEYRLAALGFLGSETLRDRTKGTPVKYSGSTGNYGILDQKMVMDWIQKNIKKFGGDPKRVMVFGQSAGGGSVSVHLVTNDLGDEYFSRAAIQSGSFGSWTAQTMQAAERSYMYLARALGCSGNSSAVLDCLLAAPAERIGSASGMSSSEVPCRDGCSWAPIVDNYFLKKTPWTLLEEGKFDRTIPLLNFFTRDDGYDFVQDTVSLPKQPTEAQFQTYLSETYEQPGVDPNDELRTIYLNNSRYIRADDDSHHNWRYYAAVQVETDVAFACPARRTSRTISQRGGKVFQGVLAHFSGSKRFAVHSDELGYLFTHPKVLKVSQENREISAHLRGYWTNFAATGNPNGEGLHNWNEFNKEGLERTMLIGKHRTTNVADYRIESCNYWDANWNYWGSCLPQPGREVAPCTTINMQQCSSLFGVGGETFSRCVQTSTGSWCATSIDAAGNPLATSTCLDTCPTSSDIVPPPRVHPKTLP
eukprot:TRINITY_DN17335_c0_g1_i1.p1 TRINITY_DN17335_c0_g1~~TRINITY_DN17335_c0_g1_i1.p1  ORF type:complete len:736 (+),score=124.39 TRINITY_DN17335_c0_g1_i1:40-2247(+)